MNVIKLNTIIITTIILLCGNLCVAEDQVFKYPIKQKTWNEIVKIEDRLEDFKNDYESHTWENPDTFTQTYVVGLKLQQVQIKKAHDIIFSLLTLEKIHGIDSYNPSAINYIIGATEKHIIVHDNWIKAMSLIPTITDHSLLIVQSDKLRGIARESKRLMQRIVEELEETERILKANESNP